MIRCTKCGKDFGEGARSVASISGSMMGDEWSESWFLCDACGLYSVQVCCEPFCGEEKVSVQGPIPKARGEVQVALIRQCDSPWDKKCRCQAHLKYFDGNLD